MRDDLCNVQALTSVGWQVTNRWPSANGSSCEPGFPRGRVQATELRPRPRQPSKSGSDFAGPRLCGGAHHEPDSPGPPPRPEGQHRTRGPTDPQLSSVCPAGRAVQEPGQTPGKGPRRGRTVCHHCRTRDERSHPWRRDGWGRPGDPSRGLQALRRQGPGHDLSRGTHRPGCSTPGPARPTRPARRARVRPSEGPTAPV